VSSNGNRSNRFENIKNGVLQGVYTLIDKAIIANARFIMDTKSHLDNTSRYNVGEVAMADYLTKKGYVREDTTGIWSPSQQTNKTFTKQSEKAAIKNNIYTESRMLKLKDGKSYNISEINSTLLDSLGYTPKEAGKLLKLIC